MHDIELQSITKTYSGTEESAVKNLSFTVEKGSITTLLGPSGCGKSTTLRLIAGFERADRGTLSLAGKVVSDERTWLPPEKRGVGMVFQDYALFPHLNVFSNVGFGYKARDRKQRVNEVLDLVNLNSYEDRYPHQLSGGQQQRVALARALTRKPVVVLFDEPFSNLDADLRIYMRAEIKRIVKEAGITAVFVSHDQKDALAISDRIIVIKDGILQQVGTPRDLYQYPENNFVATFVGQTNLIEGKIGSDGASVETMLGIVPCNHTHNLAPGEHAYISIRPDSLEMNVNGLIKGKIKQYTYTGEAIDAVIEVLLQNGQTQDLLVHIHPEKIVSMGDIVRFTVIPDFVALIPFLPAFL